MPPCREPVPDSPTPPNGISASSLTVWSLMCTSPDGIRSASSRPFITSRVRMPSDRPYSVPFASATASSRLEKATTGATGPKISSRVRGSGERHVGQHRRPVEQALVGAAGPQVRPGVDGRGHDAVDVVALPGVDDRAHRRRRRGSGRRPACGSACSASTAA